MTHSLPLDAAPTDLFGSFRGVQRLAQAPRPPAGQDPTFNYAEGGWWRVRALHATLTASAAVATRAPDLVLTDGANVYYRQAALATVVAATAREYSYVTGAQPIGSEGATVADGGMPLLWLQRGLRWAFQTTGIDPGDQWSALNLIVEQLVLGPRGEPLGPHPPTLSDVLTGEGV